MAQDIRAKGNFHEDIFADEPNKWSWPVTSTKSSKSIVNYDTHTSEIKSEESSSESEDGFILHGDSSSQKRNLRPLDSTSASEGNNQDASHQSESISHEPLLPSIYDDDAQSGNPSANYDKKDLAFRSSFDASSQKVKETSSASGVPIKSVLDDKDLNSSKRRVSSESSGQNAVSDKRLSSDKSPPQRSKNRYSGSRSPDRRLRRKSRSRSPGGGRERRHRSPYRDGHHGRDRHLDRERPRSMKSKRSRSRDSRRRSGSRSKDSRRRSRSRDRHRRYRRSSSRDRLRRKRYSRSRSKSRSGSRSRGRRDSSNHKPGAPPVTTAATTMTPQMALQQAMAAMSAKAQAMTGVTLPKYYNPAAVNPLKYAEQVQKRKLLWQTAEKVEEQPKNSVWDKLQFAQDQDGRMTAKFRKLMGIKSENAPEEPPPPEENPLQKQEELFRNLDQQYEMARVTTHTQRGVGLGYSSQALYPPVQK